MSLIVITLAKFRHEVFRKFGNLSKWQIFYQKKFSLTYFFELIKDVKIEQNKIFKKIYFQKNLFSKPNTWEMDNWVISNSSIPLDHKDNKKF